MEFKSFKEFSEEVRMRANIVDIIGTYVQLKRTGINHKGLCPFHKEKTPSFMVQERKQFFHCFGCHVGGDVVTFLMKIENLDFKSAIEFLAKRLGIPIPRFKPLTKSDDEEKYRSSLYDLMKLSADYYNNILKSSEGKKAVNYLINRGFDEQTIDKFYLGYIPDYWDNLLNYAKKKGFSEKALIDTGLILSRNDKTYYDRFRDRVIFPICDIMGRVVAFGGRIIDKGEPKYLNSPETLIYKKGQILYNLHNAKEVLRQNEKLLLTEGYVDAITVHQYGFPNVVASLGTALTEAQAQLIKRYSQEVIFIYDGDEAGQSSMLRGIEILLQFDLKIKIVVLPENLDPDSFLRKYGAEAFRELINSPMDFFDFVILAARKKFDLQTIDGKVSAISLIAPFLHAIQNPILLDYYQNKLSENLNLQRHLIDKYLKAVSLSSANIKTTQPEAELLEQVSDIPINEKRLLKLLIEFIALRENFNKLIVSNLQFLSHSICKKWINILLENVNMELGINEINQLVENESEASLLREVILWKEFGGASLEPEPELKNILNRLKYLYCQNEKRLMLTGNDMDKNPKKTEQIHKKSKEIIDIVKESKNFK